jgi:hypothetical protein
MESMRIGKLKEADFDSIIIAAGGCRFSPTPESNKPKNNDYVLGEAMVELKLVDEEGLEKAERQRKVAEIFIAADPGRPVVILRPDLLEASAQRAYYRAMTGPIKSHIEKANKQLKQSAIDAGGNPVRVLMLMNNGYATLSHDEFKDIAINRACNDTHSIDALVVGGLYYYGDGFDMNFFPQMDLFPIHLDRPFKSFDLLWTQWQAFAQQLLTKFMFEKTAPQKNRLPVEELVYELDGVRFVKPAPAMGQPSQFFVNGRPRKDSTGTSIPTVAQTFPNLSAADWRRFCDVRAWDRLSWNDFLKPTYSEWLQFRQQQERSLAAPLRPFVPVNVDLDAWSQWCNESRRQPSVVALCDYARVVFQSRVLEVIDAARGRTNTTVVPPRYVLLLAEEIGQDKANDLCSLYLIEETIEGEERTRILHDERMRFEHGLALASAYAMKTGAGSVLYEKNMDHAWV